MSFYIETFGCKVNSYESNYIKESLLKSGFICVDDYKNADIVIVNTCTVTNTADSKCKKYIRKIKRDNPESILIVVGCSSQNNYEEYDKMDIDILLGNIGKNKIPELLNDFLKTHQKYRFFNNQRDLEFEEMSINDFDHQRAFIKIQDGCDNFCSYCIIPFVRGKCRSKNFDEIIYEANKIVLSGHKEIVLTGIHTGSYNYEGKDLVDVINAISKIEGLQRIRLSSVEITELNSKFMQMLKENKKFCDHLHIPLQAGSNHILKLMKRHYDLDYFYKVIKEIRDIRPNISITTDIIVGFPLESAEDFNETYENAQKLNFSKIHVFPYSKRNETAASKMREVDSKEVNLRVHKLLELSKYLEKEYENKFKNKMVDVLVEEVIDNKSIGHTSNYLKVEIPKKLQKNTIYNIIYK